MNERQALIASWEDCHGDMPKDDVPSQINPSFEMGFRYGYAQFYEPVKQVLTMLDHLALQWGDEAAFKRARDILRDTLE